MNSRPILRMARRTAMVFAATLIAGGCATAGAVTAPPDASGSASPTGTAAASPSIDGEHQCFHVDLSKGGGPYTVADLVGRGMGFVSGRVNTTEPGMFNTSDGKKPRGMGAAHPSADKQPFPMIYTPVDVLVDRVIDGEFTPGANRFLVEGGTIGCISMSVDTAPTVVKGAQYVFVLTRALDADGNGLGNLWTVHGAWAVDATGTADTIEGPMSLDALAAKVAQSKQAAP
jgi:hypothetical protein